MSPDKICRMLDVFKETLGQEAPLHQIRMIVELYRAAPDALTYMELEDRLGVHNSTVSRNTRKIGTNYVRDGGKLRQVGLQLIEVAPDPFEPRRKHVTLTRKGQELMERALGL